MKSRQICFLLVVIGAMVLFLRSHRLIPAEDVKPIPTETVEEEIQKAMRAKLTISQDILNGLVTRDFELIQQAAGELKKVSLNAPEHIEGDETDNELYKHFRLEFLRINTLMEDMAKDENVEGAAFAYQSLTANCLACHSYLHANDDDGPIQLRRE